MSANAQIRKFATANAATGRRDSLGIRMENKRVVTTPKSECHEMLVKTDKLFRFG